MEGTVVIGEGEMDEAPMLYIGEKLGTLKGPKFDIAVDPLEELNSLQMVSLMLVLAISERRTHQQFTHTWKKLDYSRSSQKFDGFR